MAAVKMVGEGPVQMILDARNEGGVFKGLEDFADRVDLRKVGKRPLECLIKVGAFDRFGKRSQLLAAIDQMVANSASVHDARASGQLSMFDLLGGDAAASISAINLPNIDEVKGREKLLWEKELLGVYAASHPMQNLGIDISKIVTCYCNELSEEHDGKNVVLAGMISDVRTINTKKGDQMAFVNLEDLQGRCEVVVFPRTYAEVKEQLVPDTVVVMKGKAQTREGQTNLLVDSIQNYVEQAKAGGEEPTQYQRPLLDTMPTINGVTMPANGSEADHDMGESGHGESDHGEAISILDPMMPPDDGDTYPIGEESPFVDAAPAWMEVEGAVSPVAEESMVTATPVRDVVEQETHEPEVTEAPQAVEQSTHTNGQVVGERTDGEQLRAEPAVDELPPNDSPAEEMAPPMPESANDTKMVVDTTTNAYSAAANTDESGQEEDLSSHSLSLSKAAQDSTSSTLDCPKDSLPSDQPDSHANMAQTPSTSRVAAATAGNSKRLNISGSLASIAATADVQHRQPPSADPEPNGSDASEPLSNGHGKVNGHTNGQQQNQQNGQRNGQQVNGQPRPFYTSGRHIRITFRRTGDLDRDKFRLREIFERVRDPRGRDQFLILLESNGQRYELAFPNDPCTISDRLVNELTKHFRVEVAVDEGVG